MRRTFWLLLFLPAMVFAQREERIVSYDLRAMLNERIGTVAGTLTVLLDRSQYTKEPLSFLVPREWEIAAVRDHENDPYDIERSSAGDPERSVIQIEDLNEADTVRLAIEFTARFDSSRYAEMFINASELLLPCTDSLSWLPTFHTRTAERTSLDIIADANVTLFAAVPLDSNSAEGRIHWKRSTNGRTALSSSFTLAGIAHPVRSSAADADSTLTVSFITPSAGFDKRYAAAVSRQLTDAVRFFRSLTGKRPVQQLQYVIVGGATFTPEILETPEMIIHRSSPAYSLFDSSALNRIAYNHWLMETARRFTPATTDSTAFFDDGFAAYLAHRFLAERYPSLEHKERFSTIANSLTFFPHAPTVAGHRSAVDTDEIVSYRGRYIFLMLEYLLGTSSFDSVIARMSLRFADEPASFAAFQQLCEEEYGTPLDWFFEQWLRRSNAPEYVMQWSHARTPRGMSIVTVTVEQRSGLFRMPVPIGFTFGNRTIVKRVLIEQGKQDFTFVFPSPPAAVVLDPGYAVLRWLLELRISAHARTALQYLSVSRDIANAEREAQYTLQLDPNNSTGSAPLVYFVLGNSAAARNEAERGKEYFLKALASGATAETERYKLLSLVQYANLLELEGKTDEAHALYRRVVIEGSADPLLYERAIIKAELRLHGMTTTRNDAWFELP